MKYPISREFFPLTMFTPPVSERFVRLAQKNMKVPGFLWKDPELSVRSQMIEGYEKGTIELLIMTPKGLTFPAPCLLDIHGGGFVFEASRSHYRIAMTFAKAVPCMVVFVRYRLAPDHPFPIPHEDSYAALCWIYDHADELGIDRDRIGVCGDSAGGTMAVTSCMMARDRRPEIRPCLQLLVYPWLDNRGNSESNLKYTDTPMWNSSLSGSVTPMTRPDKSGMPLRYLSPVEAENLAGLPPAYIEVAEFDCLHDDGVLYADLLRREGIPVEFHESAGTIHGFDTRFSAPTSQKMISLRTEYLRRMFYR